MAIKSALTVASIALIATASSLAMAAPSEARRLVVEPNGGCAWGYEFSYRHDQCILKSKFRPVVINPMIQIGSGYRPAMDPRFLPVINPMIQMDSGYRPVIHHPYVQPSPLHPYPQTAPNPYTPVTFNPYQQTIVQPSISIPYTPFIY